MSILDNIIKIAQQDMKTIVLPEGKEQRTIDAAIEIHKQNIANVIVLVNEQDVNNQIRGLIDLGVSVEIIEQSSKLREYQTLLFELRKHKGMTQEQANELALNPIYYGVLMVKNNDADGMVAGAITSTSDVLRAALQVVKTAENVKLVSSFFIMELPDAPHIQNRVYAFSDCGLVVNPNEEELAEIAIQTSKSFDFITQEEPRVAMLSFSTYGSAKSELVDKVVNATKRVQAQYPNLKIDGELQLDAAIVPSVAKLKAPHSNVAGNANVLIFPDLQAGNIGYKLVQRFANANAFGPITQGLAKPVNDLSRGCSYEDIVGVAAITAVQAQIK